MDNQFSFDLNFDFFDQHQGPQAVEAVHIKSSLPDLDPIPAVSASFDVEELAVRITNVDILVKQVKNLQEEKADLQKQLEEFNESAESIRMLYESENNERKKLSALSDELQSKCTRLDSQLASKTLHCDQLTSQLENEKGPLSYTDLTLKFLRVVNQLHEAGLLGGSERQLASELRDYATSRGFKVLPLPKKKARLFKQTVATQCNLDSAPSANLPLEPPQAVEKTTRTQGTQYISSTTTRGTSTSVFIKTHSVGTNFPEMPAPIPESIVHIFKEMIYDKCPISPIIDLEPPPAPPVQMKTVGTNTNLRNVRKQIDYIINGGGATTIPQIKRSNSRPPSRNMYESVKNESHWFTAAGLGGATGLLPPGGSNVLNSLAQILSATTQPIQSPFAELWNLLGQIIFGLSQNQNTTPLDQNRNTPVQSDLRKQVPNCNQQVEENHHVTADEPRHLENILRHPTECYKERSSRSTSQEYMPHRSRSIATSPIHFPAEERTFNRDCNEAQQDRLLIPNSVSDSDIQRIIIPPSSKSPIRRTSHLPNEHFDVADVTTNHFPESENSSEKRKASKRAPRNQKSRLKRPQSMLTELQQKSTILSPCDDQRLSFIAQPSNSTIEQQKTPKVQSRTVFMQNEVAAANISVEAKSCNLLTKQKRKRQKTKLDLKVEQPQKILRTNEKNQASTPVHNFKQPTSCIPLSSYSSVNGNNSAAVNSVDSSSSSYMALQPGSGPVLPNSVDYQLQNEQNMINSNYPTGVGYNSNDYGPRKNIQKQIVDFNFIQPGTVIKENLRKPRLHSINKSFSRSPDHVRGYIQNKVTNSALHEENMSTAKFRRITEEVLNAESVENATKTISQPKTNILLSKNKTEQGTIFESNDPIDFSVLWKAQKLEEIRNTAQSKACGVLGSNVAKNIDSFIEFDVINGERTKEKITLLGDMTTFKFSDAANRSTGLLDDNKVYIEKENEETHQSQNNRKISEYSCDDCNSQNPIEFNFIYGDVEEKRSVQTNGQPTDNDKLLNISPDQPISPPPSPNKLTTNGRNDNQFETPTINNKSFSRSPEDMLGNGRAYLQNELTNSALNDENNSAAKLRRLASESITEELHNTEPVENPTKTISQPKGNILLSKNKVSNDSIDFNVLWKVHKLEDLRPTTNSKVCEVLEPNIAKNFNSFIEFEEINGERTKEEITPIGDIATFKFSDAAIRSTGSLDVNKVYKEKENEETHQSQNNGKMSEYSYYDCNSQNPIEFNFIYGDVEEKRSVHQNDQPTENDARLLNISHDQPISPSPAPNKLITNEKNEYQFETTEINETKVLPQQIDPCDALQTVSNEDSLNSDISTISQSPEKLKSENLSFKAPERPTNFQLSFDENSTLITKMLNSPTENTVNDFLAQSNGSSVVLQENENIFQKFLSNILDEVAPNISPISVIAPSDRTASNGESEAENSSCDENYSFKPNNNGSNLRKKRNTILMYAPTKRSERIKARQIAMESAAHKEIKLPIEIGKYTRRNPSVTSAAMLRVKQSLSPKIKDELCDHSIQENLKQEVDSFQLCMGFFTERCDADITESNDKQGVKIDLHTESSKIVAENVTEVENPFKIAAETPLQPEIVQTCKTATNKIDFNEFNDFSDSPASPQPDERLCCNITPVEPLDIPLALKHETTELGQNTLVSRLIANYSISYHKAVACASMTDNIEVLKKLQTQLEFYINQNESQMDIFGTVENLTKLCKNDRLIAQAVIVSISDAPRPNLDTDGPVPEGYLGKTHLQISELIKYLRCARPAIITELLGSIEKKLFTFKSAKIQLSTAINLTQLYLNIIATHCPMTEKNPARLFICKCIYFYNKLAIPMIYEVLCCFPTVLPHKEDRSYDRSDALITTIQHILMCTYYDMTKSDLKTKELLSKLRFQYHYDPYKPKREEVIENLLDKIRANKCKNVSYSFVLLCKRMTHDQVVKDILQQHLLPLANEYYLMLTQTSEHDKKIECLLETISMVIKPLPVETDISTYTCVFSRFLNASDRQIVQESALHALLRTSRFGYTNCFNAIYNFSANYKLQPSTKAMLNTFIHKITLPFLRQLERQANLMVNG